MIKRTITGILMTAALIVLIALGGYPFALVALFVIGLSAREEFMALTSVGHHPVKWPTWAGLAGLSASIPFLRAGSFKVFIPFSLLVCVITFAAILFRAKPKFDEVLLSVTPFLTVVLPGLYLVYIVTIQPKAMQVTLHTLIFSISILGDTFAYFIGSSVGKRPLCPEVSPSKTIEGAAGGLAGSVIGAMVTGIIARSAASGSIPFTYIDFLLIGVIGGMASQVGDLFASLLKRHCQIKDFSGIFPGHGGMMDRMDSILFVTMVVFGYLILLK